MEFRLNKVDMEVRKDINDETREGKVHSKKEIKINKDKSENGHHRGQYLKEEAKEKLNQSKHINTNEKITVEAYKCEDLEVQGEKEIKSSRNENKGLIIDVRK